MRRVVVTGLGAVSPFGAGVKSFWTGIATGSCAIRPITLIESDGFRCQIAAEVPDGIAGSHRRSRADRLALTAAREALEDAGLSHDDRLETALIVGAVGGGMLEGRPGTGAVASVRRAAMRRSPRFARSCRRRTPRPWALACGSGARARRW